LFSIQYARNVAGYQKGGHLPSNILTNLYNVLLFYAQPYRQLNSKELFHSHIHFHFLSFSLYFHAGTHLSPHFYVLKCMSRWRLPPSVYTALQPTRQQPLHSEPWEPQIIRICHVTSISICVTKFDDREFKSRCLSLLWISIRIQVLSILFLI
jgi:hypothetical protein